MAATTATLNTDGSISFYAYVPTSNGMEFGLQKWDAASVQSMQQAMAYNVTHNVAFPTMGSQYVLVANLAVQNGLVTADALNAWAKANNVTVTGIFNGTPGDGVPQYTESLSMAMNDPKLTTDAGAPTLSEATAQAAINGQNGSNNGTGPAPIPGNDLVVDQVQKAYIAYYGRPADVAGQDYWVGQLKAAGNSLDSIINAFGNSAEAQTLYGGQTIQQQITKIYQQEFNRAPEQGGMDFWVTQISNGKVSAAAAALAILQGASGNDKVIASNKLVVASAFTKGNASDALGNSLYVGDTAAANGRLYLSSVDTDSTQTVKLAGIHGAVAHDIQGDITDELASAGVHLVGVASHAAEVMLG